MTIGERKVHTHCPSVNSLVGVAKKLNLSRARVWQIELRALRKLRIAIEKEAAASGVTAVQWLRWE